MGRIRDALTRRKYYKAAEAVATDIDALEKVESAYFDALEKVRDNGTATRGDSDYMYSLKVTDDKTLDFLNRQDVVTTYKTMQIVDGKLYPPIAARVNGKHEDYSELGTKLIGVSKEKFEAKYSKK